MLTYAWKCPYFTALLLANWSGAETKESKQCVTEWRGGVVKRPFLGVVSTDINYLHIF